MQFRTENKQWLTKIEVCAYVCVCWGGSILSRAGKRVVWKSIHDMEHVNLKEDSFIHQKDWKWKVLECQESLIHIGDRGWWCKENPLNYICPRFSDFRFNLYSETTISLLLPLSLSYHVQKINNTVRVGHAHNHRQTLAASGKLHHFSFASAPTTREQSDVSVGSLNSLWMDWPVQAVWFLRCSGKPVGFSVLLLSEYSSKWSVSSFDGYFAFCKQNFND